MRWFESQGVRREDGEDIFCRALLVCLELEEPPRRPRAYLRGVVKNLMVRYLRDDKSRLVRTEALLENWAAGDPSPLDSVCLSELWDRLEAALAEHPAARRRVAKKVLDGATVRDIADDQEVTPRTVRRHWELAREVLREQLEDLRP